MKIAYLTSRYPAVSHTFILREITALRERGLEIDTFSIRRASPGDILGQQARQEAEQTRWLIPPDKGVLLKAMFRTLSGHPGRAIRTLCQAVGGHGMTLRRRLQWLAYWGEAMMLAYWLKQGSYQRLHVHFGNNGASTGMLAAALAGIPFSMTVHGSELLDPHKHRLAEKVAAADHVVCVSFFGRSRLMLLCPPQQWHKIRVIRCGQRIGDTTIAESVREPDRPARIICVGRLSVEKGHLVLLDALAALKKTLDFRCTLIGDGPLRREVEQRINTLGLQDQVTLAGSLPHDEVVGWYDQADAVVLSSFSEGVPVVLMEAMQRGRPVVATWVGGIPELVSHGESGLLVAPGNADALNQALHTLLSDHAMADRMGRAAAQIVRNSFNESQSADELIAMFKNTPPA